jgi:hypothetical protein
MLNTDLPLGFGMALAQHPDAMKKFADMSDSEQAQILSQIHNINSKEEMQQFVSNLAQD